MAYTPNSRTTIDQEVFKWVKQQKQKEKVVTVNLIRQKAFELGQELDPNFKASLNWYNNWKKRYNYSESPEAEALKHKKRHYTAAFKLHAVQRAAEMESASQASLELDVSRRCLQRWAEEVELISNVAEHSSNAVYRRPGQGRKVIDENLDKELVEWLKESWKQGTNVTVNMVREKAIEMSQASGFKASLGWYMKWQKRHGVDLKERTCNPPVSETVSPLKLRLLQEGEVFSYSPSPPVRKRRKTNKARLSYDDEALLENDEEFDRQLLTWLVERWEAGDIVTDKMVKDRAMELTSNPEFKATKAWLMAWKRKYNISLENQTYGNEGDDEGEEIIEASEVYDQQVLLEDQQGPSTSTAADNPLTPTKEEAATALASLSAEDHEATGIEIAEALQKLASAFGITSQEGAKEAMAQLTAAYQGDNPEFLLEEGGQVAVEEVISEEVVTDEPMVVIEESGIVSSESMANEITTAPVISISTSSSTGDNIVIETHTAPIVSTEVIGTSEQLQVGAEQNVNTEQLVSEQLQVAAEQLQVAAEQIQVTSDPIQMAADQLQVSTESMVVSTSPSAEAFVSEEVIISEPVMSGQESAEVEVLVDGDGSGIVIMPSTTQDEIVQQSAMADITVSSDPAIITEVVTTSEISSTPVSLSMADQITLDNVSLATLTSAPPQEIIDMVQESITGATVTQKQPEIQIYDEDFKQRVVNRAKELDSVQQAAAEFSLPWRAVASWLVDKNKCARTSEASS